MAHSFLNSTNTNPDRIRDRRLAVRINVNEARDNIILFLPSREQPMIHPEMIDILYYCVVFVAVAFFGFMAMFALAV